MVQTLLCGLAQPHGDFRSGSRTEPLVLSPAQGAMWAHLTWAPPPSHIWLGRAPCSLSPTRLGLWPVDKWLGNQGRDSTNSRWGEWAPLSPPLDSLGWNTLCEMGACSLPSLTSLVCSVGSDSLPRAHPSGRRESPVGQASPSRPSSVHGRNVFRESEEEVPFLGGGQRGISTAASSQTGSRVWFRLLSITFSRCVCVPSHTLALTSSLRLNGVLLCG